MSSNQPDDENDHLEDNKPDDKQDDGDQVPQKVDVEERNSQDDVELQSHEQIVVDQPDVEQIEEEERQLKLTLELIQEQDSIPHKESPSEQRSDEQLDVNDLDLDSRQNGHENGQQDQDNAMKDNHEEAEDEQQQQQRGAHGRDSNIDIPDFQECCGDGDIMGELRTIANTGKFQGYWEEVQLLLIERLERVLTRYMEKCGNKFRDEEYQEPNVEKFELENSKKEIVHLISSFTEPPFTLQRICELLCSPFIYYDKISTFLRGLEKNLRVS